MLPALRLLALSALLAFSLATFAQPGQTARITSGEWPPFLSEKLPHHGIASRIVTEAFSAQGIAVKYGFFPWRRALALAQSGNWDGAAVWLRNAERERDFFFSDPILQIEYVFFHRRETRFDWSGVDDLAAFRIGITNGYFYGNEFENAQETGRLTVESVPSDEQNFRKLLHGRIDAFPTVRVVGFSLLNQTFSADEIAQLSTHPKPLYGETMHLLLSKKVAGNRQLMDLFNRGLQKLRTSGRLQRYLQEAERPPASWAR